MSDRPHQFILSDLSQCRPPEALCAQRMQAGRWLTIPYQTESISGQMIFVGPENAPPPVRLPLTGIRGWHRIYIATHHGDVPDSIAVAQCTAVDSLYMLRLKLPGDPCYHVIFPERYLSRKEGRFPDHDFGHGDLVEVFWRCAEIGEGEFIEFSPAREEEGYRQTAACVAYVRLEPMSEPEIAEHARDRKRTDTRRLIGVYDGMFFGHYPWTIEQFREFVEPLRGSDFRAVCWSTSRADSVQYASRQFQIMDFPPLRGIKPYHNARDLRRAIEAGLDPLAVMCDVCHEMGVELLASMRIASQHLLPHQTFCPEPFLWSKPENRVMTADGMPTGQLSLASSMVRDRLTAVLREQAENYAIDGVHLIFYRSYPFVLFEPAARDSFAKQHRQDPATLDPRDPRWLAHKASFVTAFIGQVRAMLDEVGRARGRRLKLALHVMSCPRHNLFFGVDVQTMVARGWIDYLMPHPTYSPEIAMLEADESREPREPREPNNIGHHSVTPQRVAEWKTLVGGSSCELFPDVLPRRMPANEFRKRGIEYYAAGADGMSFHDLYWRIHRKSEWAMLSKLGHRQEMQLPAWKSRCGDFFRKRKLVSLMGLSMDPRFNPGTNG